MCVLVQKGAGVRVKFWFKKILLTVNTRFCEIHVVSAEYIEMKMEETENMRDVLVSGR